MIATMIARLGRRPGTPQFFRALLIGFVVRNIISVAALAYASYLAYVVGGPLRYVMSIIWIAFSTFAVVQGMKIFGQYRRSVQREAAMRSTSTETTPQNGGKRR